MKACAIFALMGLASALSWGGPITLLSGITPGASNNLSAGNVIISPDPHWAVDPGGAQWVSYSDTGIGGTQLANTTIATPSAVFFHTFTVTGGTGIAGNVMVWADDTATVKLDGTVLMLANPTLGAACVSSGIGCIQSEGVNVGFSAAGQTHTLEFDVYQLGNWTFGLLYDGTVAPTGVPLTTPEPSSMLLIGTGLIPLVHLGRRRLQANRKRRA